MPTLLLEHTPKPGGAGIVGSTLREYGHRLATIRVAAGEALPVDLDDVSAIVLTDGASTLASPPAWYGPECELLKLAQARAIPILGLGLGARIIAKALGGEIAPGGDCGWLECKLAYAGREDPLYKGVAWSSQQVIWQAESIAKLPEGGVPLAHAGKPGAKPALRAFSVGVFTFGFEHRFDLDQATFESLLKDRGGEAASLGGSVDAIRAGWATHGANSQRIGRRIAESVAQFLMPVDRVSAGRIKDLHY